MMAQLASLPNELIREILKLVQPEDLENFAQVSRTVFSLACPFLDEHRALIRKYHTLRNNEDVASIANLLGAVLDSPRIASYVKKVELDPLTYYGWDWDKFPFTDKEINDFTAAALHSEYLKKPSEEEVFNEWAFWCNKIEDGNEDILLAILLPRLPNLASLSVECDSRRLVWYDSAIEQVASATKPALSKLIHIRLNPSDMRGYLLNEIQKFCALPSVRTLTAPKAYGLNCIDELSPDASSNVTHLKLWESRIDSKAMYEFLRGFPKLQSFTYSSVERVSAEALNEGFMIRSSLLAHCKATLQSLTLLSVGCKSTAFMGSLRGFEALKEVYTEWFFLISEGPSSRGPQLNEHLPASLVRLKIHDSKGREKTKYERVIKSAQFAREQRLQKLKWLIFGGTQVRWSLETINRDLRKTCLNMGITLIFSPYAPKSGD